MTAKLPRCPLCGERCLESEISGRVSCYAFDSGCPYQVATAGLHRALIAKLKAKAKGGGGGGKVLGAKSQLRNLGYGAHASESVQPGNKDHQSESWAGYYERRGRAFIAALRAIGKDVEVREVGKED